MKQLLIFFMLATSATSGAQTTEDSVKTTINNLFTAMKNSDGEMLKKCFADSSVMQTIIKSKEGNIVVKNENLDEFVKSVNAAKKGSLDERITFDVLKIDGPLAIAWTPYSFYYEGNFSHCGVNSFQLVKTNEGWKIQYIIDTRRRTGCN